ncbi:hypothetical protein GTA08_BOTSDO01638 [Neofusicoccum parvum]|uniref:Uncharacterized protein n=1 Tax=Neofusicoccum parvum TaxID=310453 RepID=A0ACB5S0U4_9PEZI|nr:hypothetical protein GTA08_BOTSDO01638 [Neofusicoccum parvum]
MPKDPTYRGSYAALPGHTKAVNVVKFLPTSDSGERIILSGAADNTIRIWASDASSPTGFQQKEVLTAHTASINAIAVLPDTDIFVSGAADATIRSWRLSRKDDSSTGAELLQTIDLKQDPKTAYFPLSIALARLSPSTLVLASAGTKNYIQIYVQQQDTTFALAATLKGHEDWIRSLAFAAEPSTSTSTSTSTSDLLLASASQDKYTRLWRIHAGTALPASAAAVAPDPAMAGGALGRSLHNKAHRLADAAGAPYSVTFEALLVGHEDWIYSAQWRRQAGAGGLQLLTTSADNSIAVWEADATSGVWVSVTRLGEISAQKGATTATGSVGGFWVGLWSPDGRSVVSLGRTGGWRLWTRGWTDGAEVDEDGWTQRIAVTGHVRSVRDVKWARDGSYLLTTSADQTTRQFAQWKRSSAASWHEFSRPQIHGYDLNCLAPLSPLRFVSGADEKLLRVFDQPSAVAALLSRHCGIDATSESAAVAGVKLPDAANIPVLGLSNKAIETASDETPAPADEDAKPAATATQQLAHPPTEDHLSRHLLWPEAEKLYGHGYEISAAAAAHDGSVVATACRATSVDHAVIRLYETAGWRQVSFTDEKAPSMRLHSLTVTGLAFSGGPEAADDLLLSVGRDRVFGVWARRAEEGGESRGPTYALLHAQEKAHSRMLLGASWAPPPSPRSTEAARVFATAGRDSKVKLWRLSWTSSPDQPVNNSATVTLLTTLPAPGPVTAIAFHPNVVSKCRIVLAFGTEKGDMLVGSFAADWSDVVEGEDAGRMTAVKRDVVPSDVVNALAWRPLAQKQDCGGGDDGRELELAVGSEDGSVRIYGVNV